MLAKYLRERARSYHPGVRLLAKILRERARSHDMCIIAAFGNISQTIMEAEQLNALSNQLQDLAARSAELRRYL